MTLPRLWLIPILALVAAPLVTWLPMLALRFPWTGLPQYHPAAGIDLWGASTAWFMATTVIAALVSQRDRWLGIAVFLGGFLAFWRGAKMDPTHTILFAVGALALWAVRQTPARYHRPVVITLAGLGIFQALYVLQQHFLKYDILWGPLVGGVLNPIIQPLGTLGTVDAASAYIAITAPLLPWPLLPVAIIAVWISQSMGALAALVVGLAVRSALSGPLWRVACGASAFVVLVVPYFLTHVKTLDAVWPRLSVWRTGLVHATATDPVFGYGLGGWAQHIPALQIKYGSPTRELWREAHSEWIQWACELGALGLLVLAGWLWSHRAMFRHPRLGPSLAALAVSCGSFFTLHTVPTALLAVTLIALASPDDPSPALGG